MNKISCWDVVYGFLSYSFSLESRPFGQSRRDFEIDERNMKVKLMPNHLEESEKNGVFTIK